MEKKVGWSSGCKEVIVFSESGSIMKMMACPALVARPVGQLLLGTQLMSDSTRFRCESLIKHGKRTKNKAVTNVC